MDFFSEHCHSDTWYVFELIEDCLTQLRSNGTDESLSPAGICARRLLLHLLQSFEKYISPMADEGLSYDEFPFKHGRRDALPARQLPSLGEISVYVDEVKTLCLDYLSHFDDERLMDNDPLKSMESNYSRIQHAIFHAALHLGHIDQLLYDPSDPKGWDCLTHRYAC